MAFVYWIRKKEHTDIFTQGYVGITSKTVEERYKRHRENANCVNPVDNILYKAMLKYGSDNLVVSTLVECSYEYASNLEKKLRPERYIGWNIAIGGADPTRLGQNHSPETKEKMRAAKLGKKQSKTHIDKVVAHRMNKSPWDRPTANKETWRYADIYYLAWLSCKSHETVSRKLKISVGTLNSVFRNFENGYNPFLDPSWISVFLHSREVSIEYIVDYLKIAELFIPISFITQYLEYYSLHEGAA